MKNPHGVEPTRYMKKGDNRYSIWCYSLYGPQFGGDWSDYDIYIGDNCNRKNSCSIDNNGRKGYECDPIYKKSLFVNTAGPYEKNLFTILDYEVFCIDNYKDYIYNICKYPDIIWEYIQTKDISEESLKQINDDIELLNDLNAIDCNNNHIRLKISQLCLKNPSEFLPDTQIVNQQYDAILREWLGNDCKWKLLYRASEHNYTGKSFHECCDDKEPTLIVIKSSGGWIFGGYTTQTWSGNSIL